MSGDGERARYTFGDSATASERLACVARVFAPSTEALLARLTGRAPRRVLDLGCGPGHTTRLLARIFPGAVVCGLEQSEAFLAEARRTAAPGVSFEHADVTAMPLVKSRYSSPAVVVMTQPRPDATSRSVTRNQTSETWLTTAHFLPDRGDWE